MRRWIKVTLSIITIVVLIIVGAAGWYLSKAIPIGTGYVAKYLCSNTFISQRDPAVVFEQDIKRAKLLGADDFLKKPFNADELLERVAAIIGAS